MTGARVYSSEPEPFTAVRSVVAMLRDFVRGEVLFVRRVADPRAFMPAEVD